jgi:hypothetical protein
MRTENGAFEGEKAGHCASSALTRGDAERAGCDALRGVAPAETTPLAAGLRAAEAVA